MIIGDRWKKLNTPSAFYRISKNSMYVVLEPNRGNIASVQISVNMWVAEYLRIDYDKGFD